MATDQKPVRVGVGIFIIDDVGRVIMGKRKGSHGEGTWATPGGHLEFGESFEACGRREVLEETGLHVTDFQFFTATNDVMEDEDKHYVTVFLGCKIKGGKTQPEVREPHKCEIWEWVTWEDIERWRARQAAGEAGERTLFLPILSLLQQRPDFRPILKSDSVDSIHL